MTWLDDLFNKLDRIIQLLEQNKNTPLTEEDGSIYSAREKMRCEALPQEVIKETDERQEEVDKRLIARALGSGWFVIYDFTNRSHYLVLPKDDSIEWASEWKKVNYGGTEVHIPITWLKRRLDELEAEEEDESIHVAEDRIVEAINAIVDTPAADDGPCHEQTAHNRAHASKKMYEKHLCPHCKTPVSDESVRKLVEEKQDNPGVYYAACPNCRGKYVVDFSCNGKLQLIEVPV